MGGGRPRFFFCIKMKKTFSSALPKSIGRIGTGCPLSKSKIESVGEGLSWTRDMFCRRPKPSSIGSVSTQVLLWGLHLCRLAQEFLSVCGAATFSADMRRSRDEGHERSEVLLQCFLEFTQGLGHLTARLSSRLVTMLIGPSTGSHTACPD